MCSVTECPPPLHEMVLMLDKGDRYGWELGIFIKDSEDHLLFYGWQLSTTV